MIIKARNEERKQLVLCAGLALVLLTAFVLLQGCAEENQVRKNDTATSFNIEATDKLASSSEHVEKADGEELQSDETAHEPESMISRAEIDALIAPYGASVAVSLATLDGQEIFDINGGESFVSASMIKLLVLACLMDKVKDGALSLEQTYELNSADIVGGTGHINALPLGTALSYGELAESMIAYSDNTATNVLIDALGMDDINKTAKTYGLTETSLQRKMMDFSGSAENYMSANDAAKLLIGFASGDIGDSALSEKAIGYLKGQTDNAALAQGVPEGIPFAHKTGTLNDYRHDGGVVYAEKPYALVVFTSMGSAADDLMAAISVSAYSALEG